MQPPCAARRCRKTGENFPVIWNCQFVSGRNRIAVVAGRTGIRQKKDRALPDWPIAVPHARNSSTNKICRHQPSHAAVGGNREFSGRDPPTIFGGFRENAGDDKFLPYVRAIPGGGRRPKVALRQQCEAISSSAQRKTFSAPLISAGNVQRRNGFCRRDNGGRFRR